jgi:hypothetical protein
MALLCYFCGILKRGFLQDALDSLGGKPRHGRTVNRLLSFFSFLKKKRDEILPSSVFNVKAI